jgi:NADH dehydrogenase [ubiquinone] 1 alpha subcomplex assembly factor 1
MFITSQINARILLITATMVVIGDPAPEGGLISDFTTNDEATLWMTVNDNVMGGRSKGGFAMTHTKLLFSGSTNTDGGGFSSIRRRVVPGSIAGAKSIRMRVRGDGRTYKLGFQTGERRGRIPVAYRVDFITVKDRWQTVHIALDTATATAYGQSVSGFTLDPGKANIISLMIYDKKDGPFSLEVDWIKFY